MKTFTVNRLTLSITAFPLPRRCKAGTGRGTFYQRAGTQGTGSNLAH